MIQKDSIREEMLKKRVALSIEQRDAFSKSICLQLWNIIVETPNAIIHSFIPMGEEINVMPLLEKCIENGNKIVSSKTIKRPELLHLILTDTQSLEEGRFGTQYPKGNLQYQGEYDIIIVPGLAFDSENNRIGYGAGYYDNFLKNHLKSLKLGVAFPFQILDSVPVSDHDIKVDKVITAQ